MQSLSSESAARKIDEAQVFAISLEIPWVIPMLVSLVIDAAAEDLQSRRGLWVESEDTLKPSILTVIQMLGYVGVVVRPTCLCAPLYMCGPDVQLARACINSTEWISTGWRSAFAMAEGVSLRKLESLCLLALSSRLSTSQARSGIVWSPQVNTSTAA